MQKRLHGRAQKMIAGVCGGLAEYLDVDPTPGKNWCGS
jgi:phage shock protein PspC (stress-responsive transcriptional regulator)